MSRHLDEVVDRKVWQVGATWIKGNERKLSPGDLFFADQRNKNGSDKNGSSQSIFRHNCFPFNQRRVAKLMTILSRCLDTVAMHVKLLRNFSHRLRSLTLFSPHAQFTDTCLLCLLSGLIGILEERCTKSLVHVSFQALPLVCKKKKFCEVRPNCVLHIIAPPRSLQPSVWSSQCY